MQIELITAFTTGLLGSLHCIGMCGPICLSLPFNHSDPVTKFISIVLYNGGRISTYGALGFAFGMFGKGFELMGMQQAVSIIAGALIIAYILFVPGIKFKWVPDSLMGMLKKRIQKFFLEKRFLAMFSLGVMNGLLPCGLVYIAILAAIASGSPLSGAESMLAFGAGTLPVMMLVPYAGMYLKKLQSWKKVIPVTMTVIGLVLILRGLNLGIPYVSPAYHGNLKSSCCHP